MYPNVVVLLDRSTRKRRCISSGITVSISLKTGRKYGKVSTGNSPTDNDVASKGSSANSTVSSKKRNAQL